MIKFEFEKCVDIEQYDSTFVLMNSENNTNSLVYHNMYDIR